MAGWGGGAGHSMIKRKRMNREVRDLMLTTAFSDLRKLLLALDKEQKKCKAANSSQSNASSPSSQLFGPFAFASVFGKLLLLKTFLRFGGSRLEMVLLP